VSAVDAQVWVAVGYALVLLAAAHVLDLAARRTAARTTQWRSGGFVYHADHDAWVCPKDQWLWPQSFDPENRVMRYRASPSVCNACPVKATCTTSPHGREVTRNVDPWPSSEAERFHRGIACTVAVLAVAWPLLTMLGQRSAVEMALLAAVVVLVAAASAPLWSHLHRTPAAFPQHVPSQSADDVAGSAESRPPSTYASDRRAVQAGWSRLGRS
jgi:hypothetical protein